MKEIHFSSEVTIESFENQPWNIGDSYKVEFFQGKSIPVFLFNANSDLNDPIATLSKDDKIYATFKYPNSHNPQISLFVFCCSSGVFIFKQNDSKGNKQIKDFLSFRQSKTK